MKNGISSRIRAPLTVLTSPFAIAFIALVTKSMFKRDIGLGAERSGLVLEQRGRPCLTR